MRKALLIPLLTLLAIARLPAPDSVRSFRIVLISAEPEYSSSNSLPAFQRLLETNFHFQCTYLQGTASNDLPGLVALDHADLAILFSRRMTLPDDQLEHFKKFIEVDKPLIGLRTASHAFQNWKEWDHDVLGGNYHMHHCNQLAATARINATNASHEILRNVAPVFETGGSLYKTSPLTSGTTVLLTGSVEGYDSEPLAWTHEHGSSRIFYTSLGHPKDFENASFRNLLVNAVFWCLAGKHPALAIPVINANEAENLLKSKKAVVLDVRRPEEYAAGHIPGAINLSVDDGEFDANAGKLDTNKTYIVHCVHGLRSAKGAQKLKCLNFDSVDDFSGGIRAWEEAGKPLVK